MSISVCGKGVLHPHEQTFLNIFFPILDVFVTVAGSSDTTTAGTDGEATCQQGRSAPPGSHPFTVQPGECLQTGEHTVVGPSAGR